MSKTSPGEISSGHNLIIGKDAFLLESSDFNVFDEDSNSRNNVNFQQNNSCSNINSNMEISCSLVECEP